MNTHKYKILLSISLICNFILLALLFKPLPQEEQEMINFYRDMKENHSSLLSEEKSDEIKYVANKIIRKFADNWEFKTVKPLFNPVVLNQIGEEKLINTLELYSRLERFQKQLLPESVGTVPGNKTMMRYSSNIKYEAGEAYVSLILEQLDDGWFINNININSEVFLKQLKEQ